SAASTAARRSVSMLCCCTPGIDPIGRGSGPGWTNIGSTSCAACTRVSRTTRRIAVDCRSRRGRTRPTRPATLPAPLIGPPTSLGLVPRRRPRTHGTGALPPPAAPVRSRRLRAELLGGAQQLGDRRRGGDRGDLEPRGPHVLGRL